MLAGVCVVHEAAGMDTGITTRKARDLIALNMLRVSGLIPGVILVLILGYFPQARNQADKPQRQKCHADKHSADIEGSGPVHVHDDLACAEQYEYRTDKGNEDLLKQVFHVENAGSAVLMNSNVLWVASCRARVYQQTSSRPMVIVCEARQV